MNPEALTELAATQPVGFYVYYRPRRGVAWEPIGRVPTQLDALRVMDIGKNRGGDWVVTTQQKRPSRKRTVTRTTKASTPETPTPSGPPFRHVGTVADQPQ